MPLFVSVGVGMRGPGGAAIVPLLLVGAGAYLTDPGLEALEIQKGVRTAAGVPQDGGGVEHGHHGHAGLFKPKTVLPGDFEIRLDETHGGDPPQTDDDLWTDEGHLVAKVVNTGVLLRIQDVYKRQLWDSKQWNKYRQEVILNQMLKEGYITQEEHDQAVAQELVFVGVEAGSNTDPESAEDIYSWYEEQVITDVMADLQEKYGYSDKVTRQMLSSGGLRIYTCIDPEVQEKACLLYTSRCV